MILNRVFSFLILLFIWPLLILIALLIYFDDGLPIIFKQKRVGKHNEIFNILKFRTMKISTPHKATHVIKDFSLYYTKYGFFIRKMSIDELPQLFNILKGEMAFIGPRPALYNQMNLISERRKYGVDKILPGITGWAQVNGRDELRSKEKVKFDLYYLRNKSIFLDIKILILTIVKVISFQGVIK